MEQVTLFGFARTSNIKAAALEVALAVSAHDIVDDANIAYHFDKDVWHSFLEVFPPKGSGSVLSGLWDKLYPNLRYDGCEYHAAAAASLRVDDAVIFHSDRGDVDAAARMLELVLRDQDYATIWWNDLDLPTGHAQPQVIRIGSEPPLPSGALKLGQAVGRSPALTELAELLTSHCDMYNLALSMAEICCASRSQPTFA